MPAEDGRRLDEEEPGPLVFPDLTQSSPQKSIGPDEFRPLDRALQNTELMAECEDLQLQRRAAPERSGKRGKER